MKKLVLLTLLSLFIGGGFAQQHQHVAELSCSKAKFYQEYYKNAQEIIQTPLLFDYDVKFYYIDIEVDNNSIYITGEVTIMAEVVATELDTFAVEFLSVMTIDEVIYNGNTLTANHTNDEAFIILPETLTQGELFSVNIKYHGTPPTGGFFAGVSNGSASGKNITWTLSEPFAARSWFPVKQVLEDKADSAWIFLTTDEDNMAGSNGLLTNVTPMPDNKLRYEWKTNYPIDFYLISFAVSEYQDYSIYTHPEELNGDSILIQNFIYDSPDYLNQWQEDIDLTADFIDLFSELFSLYPFHEEKYGHCTAPMNGGAMEHQTMTTITNFNFGLVAHELGHMWFGDNITCATWSDIWINEGFATYADYLAVQFILGQSAANSEMNATHNSVMSQAGGSTYIPPEEITYDNVWRIFDGRLSYSKGAAILHMIRFELQDDELFFQVFHDYTDMYADSVATGLDFMNVLNDVSGMDFTDFFDQWYFGEGYPTYSVEWSQNEGGMFMKITQTTSKPSVTPLFTNLMAYKFHFLEGGDTTVFVHQTENVSDFTFPITKEIGLLQVDPANWVVNQTGSITTNVEQHKSPVSFTCSPNPANDKLKISFANQSDKEKQIGVYDMAGNQVLSENTLDPFITLEISDLPSSTYLIQITDGINLSSKKFIKVN
ncbi:MAG: T9SS type A sorting domain-containing protein [Bacteroidales bacterium]|nr:T9SS type A sorting domain-containing protein [Bacteroidales bacterium]